MSTSYKYSFTINKGSALGSSIQSVALYAIADPGTPTILLDNIIACKASSSADALSLTSLISKNSAASGGDEGWYPIQSINGTTVLLDNGPAINANAGRGYYGTTETVATYKREVLQGFIRRLYHSGFRNIRKPDRVPGRIRPGHREPGRGNLF